MYMYIVHMESPVTTLGIQFGRTVGPIWLEIGDQRIIQNFKVHYRKLIMKKIISGIEEYKQIPTINILDACHFTK